MWHIKLPSLKSFWISVSQMLIYEASVSFTGSISTPSLHAEGLGAQNCFLLELSWCVNWCHPNLEQFKKSLWWFPYFTSPVLSFEQQITQSHSLSESYPSPYPDGPSSPVFVLPPLLSDPHPVAEVRHLGVLLNSFPLISCLGLNNLSSFPAWIRIIYHQISSGVSPKLSQPWLFTFILTLPI